MDQEGRVSGGDTGVSEEVELLAAVAGLAILFAQVMALSLSLRHGGSVADTMARENEFMDEVENPLREPEPEPEPEPEQEQEQEPPKIDDRDNPAGNDGDGTSDLWILLMTRTTVVVGVTATTTTMTTAAKRH
eukprot:COSAG02_NODE_1082_length_14704_cov_49.941664_10_plen_133_part_00